LQLKGQRNDRPSRKLKKWAHRFLPKVVLSRFVAKVTVRFSPRQRVASGFIRHTAGTFGTNIPHREQDEFQKQEARR
jgi:hypothetical protein